VENIVDQCQMVEDLCMGDEELIAMVREVQRAIRPYAINPNQLRESPITRKTAAATLEEVASRMGFMMGA
jgi:hypothetical protein